MSNREWMPAWRRDRFTQWLLWARSSTDRTATRAGSSSRERWSAASAPCSPAEIARDEGKANAIIESVAYLEQARVAEALGHDALARTYYQRFLWRYDKSSEAHRHLVEEARAVLVRLGRSGRRERVR